MCRLHLQAHNPLSYESYLSTLNYPSLLSPFPQRAVISRSFDKSQHYRFRRFRVQCNINLHLLAAIPPHKLTPLERLENATEHILQLHPCEVAAEAYARAVVEGDELVEFGRPVGPTVGVEGVRCRPHDVMTALHANVGENCIFEK